MADTTTAPPGIPPAMAALRPVAEALIAQFHDMDERIKWIQRALIELNKKMDAKG